MRPITGCSGPAIGVGIAGFGVDLVTGLQKRNVNLGMALFRCHKTNGAVVQLSIVPPTFQLGGLREGAPDFAVMSLPAVKLGPEFITRALYATTVSVVVRPGHPLEQAQSLSQLVDAEWVLPSLESSVARGLGRAFHQARLSLPKCTVTCQTLTGLETLVQHSDLVAAMPMEVHESRMRASGLRRVPIKETIDGARVAIVRWADARPTPAAEDLEESFVQAAYQLAREKAKTRGRVG
jgi:DNA-binding transcriptional LysR family regulator